MRKLKSTLLVACALICACVLGTSQASAFNKLAIQVNNQEGTLLTADEQSQGTAFSFFVAEDENGATVRVDEADAAATVSGKYHSDHGSNNLKVVVPVEGKTKITFGNCTYNGGKFKVTPAG